MDAPWDPIGLSLAHGHSALALRRGAATAYPADISPLAAFAGGEDAWDAWDDLGALRRPGEEALVLSPDERRPPGHLEVVTEGRLLAMAGPFAPPPLPPEPGGVVRLGLADSPEMVELAAATRPGPMLRRTVLMGDFWGVRRGGRLIAMCGTRMRPPGMIEVSGVAADPCARGEGLARWLILKVLHGIAAEGARPFLHLYPDNVAARTLYERLGFEPVALPYMRWVRF